ncbi:hypothetical protein GCM10023189_21110 [Nibrella saemangeumensis]|uniref:Outer membrane protein beta-barrel domain-containing protein n=1 Tax=Nibrella saemangeumensis TaxID=1084526 RepID=A0ABP8MUN6_9BACT
MAVLVGLFTSTAWAQEKSAQGAVLDAGIRLQKSIGLYYENGLTLQYTNPRLAGQRLYVGVSYVTSRLGSAFRSNAIKQDNYLVSGTYMFRPQRHIRPLVRFNVGYFSADLGSDLFNSLPHSGLLASPEFGLCYSPRSPLKLTGSLGYNLTAGNGMSGPGTLYPVFVQTSLLWNILKK